MKQLNIIICAIGIVCASVACSDMLETESSRQVFDPQLDEKTDSVFYALGILQGMQELADQYVFQGEMRGDLVQTTAYTDNNLRQLANFSTTTANKYDSAYVYYRVINNCNYYIAHRDTTLRTGSEAVAMKEYVAIKALRAWVYMQLARTYGKVPFYTEPLTQISQIDSNDYPELDMAGIVARLAPDLEQYTGYQTPEYGNTVPANSVFFPAALFIPVDLVLGDMYLETEEYGKAANHYITYLTQGTRARSTGYQQLMVFRARGGMLTLDYLPSDWDFEENFSTSLGDWSDIFSTNVNMLSGDVISYVPMAQSSREGATTLLPKTFGYDFYANTKEHIGEIQIQASASYQDLSAAQGYYYYSTQSSAVDWVINTASIGDTRWNAITEEDEDTESDSITTWITKFDNARILLYRGTTVYLRLAEAFNRLGMYDAAFAILKDGINTSWLSSPYVSDATREAVVNQYPLLSAANRTKFDGSLLFYCGVHGHGTGYASDFRGNVYTPGLSPYQLEPIVGAKLADIAQQYGVTVGTTKQDTINAVEDLICDEYALELAFEGGRFNDLCRMARHKNKAGLYDANFGGRWLARKLAYKNAVVNLEEEQNWYLPFK